MKKILSLILALILTLSLCAVAFADDPNEVIGTVEIPSAGLHFVPPEAYQTSVGQIVYDGYDMLDQDLYYATWYYCAMTEEELTALYTGNTAEDYVPPVASLFFVFSLGNGMDSDELIDALEWNKEYVHEIGKIGKWTFCLYMEPIQEFIDDIDPLYKDEYVSLVSQPELAVAAFTCYEPVEVSNSTADVTGTKIEFTAKDLDGNTVSSADLFAQNEITMINVWATWCGPCVGELAELQQIYTRLQEKGCGIIGLLDDTDLKEARNLVAQNGITYPIIIAPDDYYTYLPMTAYPSTFFVNRNGELVGETIVGAYPNKYEPAIESLLQK